MKRRISIIIAVWAIVLAAMFSPVTARAEIASGTCGTCSWVIDDEGTLTISPTDGTSGTLADINSYTTWPWYNNRAAVKKVVIEEGVAAQTNAEGMFYGMSNCADFQVNKLDTGNVHNMQYMFSGCTLLTDTTGLAGWNTGNATSMENMFSNCKLADISGLAEWDTGNVTNMSGMFTGCRFLTDTSGFAGWDTGNVASMEGMFYNCSSLADTSGLNSWNTSKVTNVKQLFYNCSSLTNTSGLTNWNTGNVTNMERMFSGCKSLTDISGLAGWNTGKVTKMGSLFNGCSSLADTSRLANWDTGKVTDIGAMFYDCSSLTNTSGLANWNTGRVTGMRNMFQGCSSLLDISGLANWDTGKVTSTRDMFSGCSSLTGTSGLNWDTGSITDMYEMFYNCSSLTGTSGLNNWDTGGVTNMGRMFSGCTSLADTSNFANWNTGKVTDMSDMFKGCASLVDTSGLAGWDTGNVTRMNNMFSGCASLTDTSGLAGWDTGKVTNMTTMFSSCTSLADTSGLAGWNTGNVTDMGTMFYGCTSLADIAGLAGWDTGNVTSMGGMFSGCVPLTDTSVLADWDTSNVTNMNNIFKGCTSLVDTSGFANWDTGNVTGMLGMFSGCTSLTDASSLADWDTGNVTSMNSMFSGCKSLEVLDMSGWNTSKVTTFASIFTGNQRLKRINLGENVKFKGNNIMVAGRGLALPTPPSSQDGISYTGKWIREDGSAGPFTPAEMITNYSPEMAGWWIWEEVPVSYRLSYAAPDQAAGSMAPETVKATEGHTLPGCGYVLFANRFDHWIDGMGNSYPDQGTIPANRYSVGDQVTLTAVFVPIDTKVNMVDGAFEVSLHAGEKAKFDGIPAGTAYQVYEETPDGWVLVKQADASGSIKPTEEALASFTNRYQPDITSVQFSGSKTLDSRPAEEGSYTFQLIENGVVIQEKTILPGGFIQFDPITYERGDAGVHVYTIREKDSGNDAVEHDTHEETITVTVTDNGDGTLSSTASYDEDGIVFANKLRPGTLKLGKIANGATDANSGDTFKFRITFQNENGQPLEDDIYWYVEEDGVPVSDTQQ